MSTLTDELVEDHQAIIEMLLQAGADGAGTREAREMIGTVKEVLLSHFRKEDSLVYPPLMNASEQDPELRHMLGVFLKDLEKVTRSAMDFLERYSEGGSGGDFDKDLERFMAIFRERVKKEEGVLYRKFDAIY